MPSFWQPVFAEQKGKDLILISQISYFILFIKIPDKDLLQHFVALTKLSGGLLIFFFACIVLFEFLLSVCLFRFGICVFDFAVH